MNIGCLLVNGVARNLKGFGILAVLFGGYWIYDSFGEKRAAEKLAKDGKEVIGLITDGKVKTLKLGIKLHEITVTYKLPGQDPTTKPFSCSDKFIQSHIQNGVLVNPSVNIRYIESEPETAVLAQGDTPENHSGDRFWVFGIGVGMVLIGNFLERKVKAAAP